MNAKWFNKHKIFSIFYKHGLFNGVSRLTNRNPPAFRTDRGELPPPPDRPHCFRLRRYGRRIFRPKMFSAENIFGRKIFRPKNFSAEKLFGRKIVQPKNCSTKFVFRPKHFSAKNFAIRITQGGSNGGSHRREKSTRTDHKVIFKSRSHLEAIW